MRRVVQLLVIVGVLASGGTSLGRIPDAPGIQKQVAAASQQAAAHPRKKAPAHRAPAPKQLDIAHILDDALR
jgi:hypothetical protein